MSKIIILRGPSASGKSTIAFELKKRLISKIALLEFDYYRNKILALQENYYEAAAEMYIDNTLTALNYGYDVVMDGIYRMAGFEHQTKRLLRNHKEVYMFYFDISLQETIERHKRRNKSGQFTVDQLKDWYYEPSATGYKLEYAIPENYSIEETIGLINNKIYNDTN